jgi:phage gp45-like
MSSNDSGMSGLFAQGLAMAQSYGVNKQPQDIDLDGDGVISAYERAYAQGGAQGGQMDANSMGAAAAMQAMKSFTGNGGGAAAASSGGNMQSKASHHACP